MEIDGSTDTTERIGKTRSVAELFNWSKRESEETEDGDSGPYLVEGGCGCAVLRVEGVELEQSTCRGNVVRCVMSELRFLEFGEFGGPGDPEDILRRVLGCSVRRRTPLLSHPIGSRIMICDNDGKGNITSAPSRKSWIRKAAAN